MDKKKIEEINKALQKLLDREKVRPETMSHPKRTRNGSGNIIRRRKGEPDKRLSLPSCSHA